MASASDFISSGIKAGDNARLINTTVTAGVETTVLNISGKGIVTGIAFDANAAAGLTNIKVTVDGAAERTLNYNDGLLGDPALPANVMTIVPFAPIRYKTSIVIKVNTSGVGTACKVAYSVG